MQFARAMLPAFSVALVVITPYLLAYVSNRSTLGERQDSDIAMYSATLANYLSATPENVVHGEWSAGLGRNERRLFPGVIALTLAVVGVVGLDRRRVTLIIAGAVGFIVSLGFNTPLYEPLRTILFPYRGLRAPARASILVFLAVAGLAAYGYARLTRGQSRAVTALAAAALSAAMLIEYRNPLRAWLTLPAEPPQVYRWLATQPRSVVAEVPFAEAHRLDRIFDGLYMFNSTYHWQPIVNGYSGFFPRTVHRAGGTDGRLPRRSIDRILEKAGRGFDRRARRAARRGSLRRGHRRPAPTTGRRGYGPV